MTTFTRALLLFIIAFNHLNSKAQNDSSQLFSAPLAIPMYLAGNFGEIRSGHFHAGIDIKTQQLEGFPVLAAADGYVSRVKISLGGYGNALYITHPNGYTTTYGHLQQFNEEITKFVRKEQYAKEKFEVELFFPPSQIKVLQGDTVALSGNTGGSGGPHLHFEIRTTNGSVPQNPLKFGFDIKDNIPPIFKNLALYPLNDTSSVNGQTTPIIFPIRKSGKNYVLANNTSIKARGVIGFGIEAIDKLNGSNNRCGVYNITLTADTSVIYSHQMDAISFDETRFINTHVDFYNWKKNKKRVQKSYLNSYNKLQIYHHVQNNGKVYFSKFGHQMNYTIKDVYGNSSQLNFDVAVDSSSAKPKPKETLPKLLPYNQPNTFSTKDITVRFTPYSFYEDLPFTHSLGDTIAHAVAPVHYIQTLYSPLQKYMQVSIKTDSSISKFGDKLIAVSLTNKLRLLSPEGGTYSNGWVTFKTRSFGPYTIMIDTISPTITPVNFKASTNTFSENSELKLVVKDTLSGIKKYDAYIDGKWHLLQFDAKTGLIWLDFKTVTPNKGPHTLVVRVADAVNNFKVFTFNFIW